MRNTKSILYLLFPLILLLLSSCYQNGPTEQAEPDPLTQTISLPPDNYPTITHELSSFTLTPTSWEATPTGIESGTLIKSSQDGMVMVYIPAGEFLMGISEDDFSDAYIDCLNKGIMEDTCESWLDSDLHQTTVYLDAYWIDQSEVTHAMFAEFLNDVGDYRDAETNQQLLAFPREHPFIHYIFRDDEDSFYVQDGYEDYPISGVQWAGANAYCQWAGRRLPTEAEWEKAARGTDGQPYPWGSEEPSCILANNMGCYGGYFLSSLPVGSLLDGSSPFGVLNMSGNVYEWVSDYFDEEYYLDTPSYNPNGAEPSDEHVIKGGSFDVISMSARSSYRFGWDPSLFSSIPTGIRCAQSFSPSQVQEPTISPYLNNPVTPIPTSTPYPIHTPTPLPYDQYLLDLRSVDNYIEELKAREKNGWALYCHTPDGGEDVAYSDCETFYELKDRGCYGWNTVDINREYSYDSLCQELTFIGQVRESSVDNFNLESPDWWKSLPASVIPGRGGIYSEEGVEQARIERDELVKGKLLGEIEFVSVNSEYDSSDGLLRFSGVLSREVYDDCGSVDDLFFFYPALLADFDSDGIGELLVSGYRNYDSEDCFLGTGNRLGAFFDILINKDDPSTMPYVVPYP